MSNPHASATDHRKTRKPRTPRDSYRHGNLREALVAEAVALMEERADASFTLREAAHRIRVSHTAAYRHFPSKGALLAELAQRGFALLATGLRAGLSDGGSAEQTLCLQARAYVRCGVENPALFRCMFGPHEFDTATAASVEASCDVCFQLLHQAVTRLRDAHRIKTPADTLSLHVWSMVHGLTNLALDGHICEVGNKTLEFEEMAEHAVDALVNGLLKR